MRAFSHPISTEAEEALFNPALPLSRLLPDNPDPEAYDAALRSRQRWDGTHGRLPRPGASIRLNSSYSRQRPSSLGILVHVRR